LSIAQVDRSSWRASRRLAALRYGLPRHVRLRRVLSARNAPGSGAPYRRTPNGSRRRHRANIDVTRRRLAKPLKRRAHGSMADILHGPRCLFLVPAAGQQDRAAPRAVEPQRTEPAAYRAATRSRDVASPAAPAREPRPPPGCASERTRPRTRERDALQPYAARSRGSPQCHARSCLAPSSRDTRADGL
jgi:hypothetical protein